MNASVSDVAALVTFRGGLVVPLEALQLAWSLEDRGAVFGVDGAELVVDLPSGVLTVADQTAIRRWKHHLMAIVTYETPTSEAAQ